MFPGNLYDLLLNSVCNGLVHILISLVDPYVIIFPFSSRGEWGH